MRKGSVMVIRMAAKEQIDPYTKPNPDKGTLTSSYEEDTTDFH